MMELVTDIKQVGTACRGLCGAGHEHVSVAHVHCNGLSSIVKLGEIVD
jgi:hypothetical protein